MLKKKEYLLIVIFTVLIMSILSCAKVSEKSRYVYYTDEEIKPFKQWLLPENPSLVVDGINIESLPGPPFPDPLIKKIIPNKKYYVQIDIICNVKEIKDQYIVNSYISLAEIPNFVPAHFHGYPPLFSRVKLDDLSLVLSHIHKNNPEATANLLVYAYSLTVKLEKEIKKAVENADLEISSYRTTKPYFSKHYEYIIIPRDKNHIKTLKLTKKVSEIMNKKGYKTKTIIDTDMDSCKKSNIKDTEDTRIFIVGCIHTVEGIEWEFSILNASTYRSRYSSADISSSIEEAGEQIGKSFDFILNNYERWQ